MSVFEVKVSEEFTLKGNEYPHSNPVACLMMITGMNEHSSRYESFAWEMNHHGIHVCVLDHFGQGENAKSIEDQEKWPRIKNAWNLELKALNLKIKELRMKGVPVYLMGHSMGSFSVQAYLEQYPGSVDKAVIMGSNGSNNKLAIKMGYVLASLLSNRHNWDKRAKILENASLGPYIRSVKDRKDDNDWLSYNEENVKAYNADPYCGHYNTFGFFYGFMRGMKELYKGKNLKRISKDQPILLVAGEEDPVGANGKGPKDLEKMYKKLGVRDVTLHLYPHMRHEILNEKDRNVPIQDILEFLMK